MTNETAIYFILPAALALMIKLVVLIMARSDSSRSAVFFTMVLVFAAHNLAEVLGFLEYFRGDRFDQVLRWYYVMSFCGLSAMLMYAADVSGVVQKKRALGVGLITVSAVLTVLVLFTNSIVAGSESIGYALTAVQGPLYVLFPLMALISYSLIVWMLVSGYRRADSHLQEIQISYTMLALAPIVIVALALLVAMAMGAKLNAAAILPLCTTLFLLITLKSELQHKLTDLRRYIPNTLERKSADQILEVFSDYARDEVNYRDAMTEIERMMVMHKHDKHRGNVSSTAASMDLPRSSLYSIFRRLEINTSESRN